MSPRVSLATVFRAVAAEFLVSDRTLRSGDSERGREARQAFCLVAADVTGTSTLAIGSHIGQSAAAVEHALAIARQRYERDGTWARRILGLEAEAMTEGAVTARLGPDRPDHDPDAIARRCTGDDRQALDVSLAQLRILGAAYLALREEQVTAADRANPRIVAAAQTFARAERAWRDARQTVGERAATQARQEALDALVDITLSHTKESARVTAA